MIFAFNPLTLQVVEGQRCHKCRSVLHVERYLGKNFWIDEQDGDTCPADQGEHVPCGLPCPVPSPE